MASTERREHDDDGVGAIKMAGMKRPGVTTPAWLFHADSYVPMLEKRHEEAMAVGDKLLHGSNFPRAL